MNEPEIYMKLALEEARKASWPFGAVLVKNGEIVVSAGAGDGSDELHDPTAHAETNVIRRASLKLDTGNLSDTVLYASCEPCAMCFGAAFYAGIKKIVFGTSLTETQEFSGPWGGDLGFPHEHISESGIDIEGGVLRDEIMQMYKTHPRVIGSK